MYSCKPVRFLTIRSLACGTMRFRHVMSELHMQQGKLYADCYSLHVMHHYMAEGCTQFCRHQSLMVVLFAFVTGVHGNNCITTFDAQQTKKRHPGRITKEADYGKLCFTALRQ